MPDTIDVYSDLVLHVPTDERPTAIEALKLAAKPPWTFDPERSEELQRNVVGDEATLAFSRAATEDFPAAGLSIWRHAEGFYVPNVVPTAMGQLTYAQYNGILADFAERVVQPVADAGGYRLELTPGRQSLTDWVSEDVARKLSAFSSLANKSTGSSHPSDERRWFAFIVAAHRTDADLDVDRLARWLQEVERWDEDSAHSLAGRYEWARSLLKFADEH